MGDQRLTKLCDSIELSLKNSCKDKISISFSGGIDSTLIAFLARKYCDVELIAVGIGHDVSRYYKKAVTIMDVDQLGEVLLNELSNIFIPDKKRLKIP